MSGTVVEYRVEEADVLRLYEHYSRTSAASRRLRLVAGVGAPVATGFAIAWLLAGRPGAFVWAALGALTVAVVYFPLGAAFNRAVWRRHLREGKRALLGMRTLTIDSNGIRSVAKDADGSIRWAAIDRVEEDKDYIYFILTGGGFAVPKGAFPSATESQAFLRAAHGFHRAASEGDP